MNYSNLFRIAVRALVRNKLRAFLTMLGIIIGVASVIAMLAIGEGSKQKMRKADLLNGNKHGYGNAKYATTGWCKSGCIKFCGS